RVIDGGLVVKDLRCFGISDFGLVEHLRVPSRRNPRKHGPVGDFDAVVPALSEVRRHDGAGAHCQGLCIACSGISQWRNGSLDPEQKRAAGVLTRHNSEWWLVVFLSDGDRVQSAYTVLDLVPDCHWFLNPFSKP